MKSPLRQSFHLAIMFIKEDISRSFQGLENKLTSFLEPYQETKPNNIKSLNILIDIGVLMLLGST